MVTRLAPTTLQGPTQPMRTSVLSEVHALAEVLNNILDAVMNSQTNPIILNSTHIQSLDFGLPEGQTYRTTTPDNQRLSCVVQALQALIENGNISSFEISNKMGKMEIHILSK